MDFMICFPCAVYPHDTLIRYESPRRVIVAIWVLPPLFFGVIVAVCEHFVNIAESILTRFGAMCYNDNNNNNIIP